MHCWRCICAGNVRRVYYRPQPRHHFSWRASPCNCLHVYRLQVKAATGEIITAEELGGASIHCKTSGVTDHMAENDLHAVEIARNVISSLPANKKMSFADAEPPLFDISEIDGIIGTNLKRPFDVKKVIARLVDGSKFHEFKAEYAKSLVTGTRQQ